ncbi:DUF3237 domain-containing protein [Nonomuraea longicatena]|uniref:UPF0311 protein GCM10009560_15200 n=1 Tax=Nonomuraea longicatena TaxID=83682 RepID=A0ABP3ZDJ3_9ACTN
MRPVRPHLEPLALFRLPVAAVHEVGQTPHGRRRVIDVAEGRFDGERFSGRVLGGGDWQLVHADGSASLDSRHTLRTDDGALLQLSATGVRHGPAEVLAALGRGEPVDPAAYYFRLALRFETADPAYRWLNHRLTVASGARTPREVVFEAYTLT